MGRTDAVQFTLEWAAEAKRLGAIVEFEPGWESRGNGMTADYEAAEIHHTAFLSSEGNPFPAKDTLKNGRTGLPGPLANVGGPWCEDGAPRLRVMAAHPSNNAGASGGYNTAPLPVTSLFNKLVFALEIDYGGVVPMTKGQRKAATIFARAVINVLKKPATWVKAHAETSVTGKWDPGYANGKTIDMAEFRQGVTNFAAGTPTSEEDDTVKFKAFRSDPAYGGNGAIALASPGIWWLVPDPGFWNLVLSDGVTDNYRNVAPNVFDFYRALYMLSEVNDAQMAAALAQLSADEAARAAASKPTA